MNYPTEGDVRKLGAVMRSLAGFILVCSILAGLGLGMALVTEPFHPIVLLAAAVIILMAHISGSVAFRGFAPRYLLFAHGPK
jgi:hypothetical protein